MKYEISYVICLNKNLKMMFTYFKRRLWIIWYNNISISMNIANLEEYKYKLFELCDRVSEKIAMIKILTSLPCDLLQHEKVFQ